MGPPGRSPCGAGPLDGARWRPGSRRRGRRAGIRDEEIGVHPSRPRHRSGPRWRLALAALAAGTLAIAAPAVAAGPVMPAGPADPGALAAESPALKADLLWNIARFIRWPDKSFAATQGEFVIAILGEDELAAELASRLSQRSVNGRPVFVRFVRRVEDARGSHMLYIASSEIRRAAEALSALAATPALTVADTAGFCERGGMVSFAHDADRVRFEINQGRAERAGLRISARLLALARVVDAGE
jgi:hypothetical protein